MTLTPDLKALSEAMLPCSFCGGVDFRIEPGGQTWMGVKGYSEPQYFHLYHNGKVPEGDGFQSCAVQIRARTEAELHSIWNYRPANQLFTQADLNAIAQEKIND